MPKINDWIIEGEPRSTFYVAESGTDVLLRNESRDVAEIKTGAGNILINTAGKTLIIVDESKKTITIRQQ